VTDEGLAHLAQLDLWRLSLAGSKVTASGLKHLMTMSRLELLDLSQTAITEGDVERLHRALPKLKIYGGTEQNTWSIEGARGKSK
jgi:hypothetical protein